MLGKRSRPPMKRTTSMSEIKFEFRPDTSEPAPPSNDNPHFNQQQVAGFGGRPDQLPSAATTMASPGTHRRSSTDLFETAHFLRSCSLCKRRLVPSRDIYMYRGDSAFCSPECRQLQMNHDERKGKSSIASKKETTSSTTTTTTVSEVPTKGDTVVAL